MISRDEPASTLSSSQSIIREPRRNRRCTCVVIAVKRVAVLPRGKTLPIAGRCLLQAVLHTHTQALRYGAGGGQVDMFRQGWGEGLVCSDLLTDLTYPCLSPGLPD